jgi:type VII secretion protein EccB
MGLRLTTKVQVSGWRFLLRRVEHALVRRDTRMFDDPLQFYSRSMTIGVVISVLVVVGAAALAFFKPQGKLDGGAVYADHHSYQLYLDLSGRLHPIYNLTSARLVLGKPADPTVVETAELDKLPKGQWIGIPGAPYATPVSGAASDWALCDTIVNLGKTTQKIRTALISMPLVTDAETNPVRANEAVLASYRDQEWLVTPEGRHAIDRSDRALTSAVGIPVDARPVAISEGLFNSLPDAGTWQLPPVPGAGEPNSLGLPAELVIGSVFQTNMQAGPQYYLVLPNGVATVNNTTAAALRATQSYGLVAPPSITADAAIAAPNAVYRSPLPDEPLTLVAREDESTMCQTWRRATGDPAPKITVITGPQLPIASSALNTGIDQIQSTATVYMSGGNYIQVRSPDPLVGEALYYIDRQGVRYGIPDQGAATALGLASPKPAPWEVVRLLVDGPVLSQAAALLEHDTLPTDPLPRKLDSGAN